MMDAGLLQDGDEPSSEQYAEYGNRLNDVINFFGTQGLKLWVQQDINIPLVSGQQAYTLGPSGNVVMTKPLRIIQAYYHDTTSPTTPVDRPLFPLSWQEWLTLSSKSTTGAISQYFVDKQQAALSVSFWLTPDSTAAANGSAHVLVQGQLTNFTGITDTMGFPQEWFMALRWNLADDICTGQPQSIMDRCRAKAEIFRQALEGWDVEDASTLFSPDTRGGQASSFR